MFLSLLMDNWVVYKEREKKIEGGRGGEGIIKLKVSQSQEII